MLEADLFVAFIYIIILYNLYIYLSIFCVHVLFPNIPPVLVLIERCSFPLSDGMFVLRIIYFYIGRSAFKFPPTCAGSSFFG